MRRPNKKNNKTRALFNVILSVALLVQGVMFSQLVQCGDDHLKSAPLEMTDSHAGHGGPGHVEPTSEESQHASAPHLCPMGGCYVCPPEECGQCSAAKLAVLVTSIDAAPPHYVFLNRFVDRSPVPLERDILRLLPPGRAPPLQA